MPRTWPLVGRNEELRVAGRALGPRADRSGVVLSGPAGVGKTRLAREAVARVEKGRTVHWALATESSREMPLAAFGGLLDGLGPPGPTTLARAAERLTGGASDRHTVLAVDDAHLLDDHSAVLVHRLVTRGRATAVLTARDGEPAPDAIAALWKDEHVVRVPVEPLPEPAVADLLERVLAGPVDGAAGHRLWTLAGGNALFLKHLVDGELAAGRLIRIEGVWCWLSAPELTDELTEIVRRQMGDLPQGVRDTVDVLALGEPLAVAAVNSLTSSAALEDAEARGLARIEQERGRFRARLAHPMYGEVRRAELGTLRARRLRGLIASTLVAVGDADADPVRRAVLHVDSDLPPDPGLFLTAAEHAFRLCDLELAERLSRAAVDAGGGFDAELVLAHALSWSCRGEEADSILTGLQRRASNDVDRMRVGMPWACNLFWTLNRADAGEAAMAAALAGVEQEELRDPLLACRATMDMCRGRVEQAFAVASSLLEAGTLPDGPIVMAAGAAVGAAAVTGRLDKVRWAAALGHSAAGRDFNAVVPQFGLADWHILALRLAGEIAEAGEVAARLQRYAEDVPGPARPMGLILAGQAAMSAGRVATARHAFREARAGLRYSTHEFRYRALMSLCAAEAVGGDVVGARSALRETVAAKHLGYTLMDPEVRLAEAWICAIEGSITQAIRTAYDAADLARELGGPAYEVLALQTAAQFGDASGAARLEALAGVVEGPRAAVAHAHACALADCDGDALSRVSQRWGEIGDLIAAADAVAQAAVQFRAADRSGSALAAAHRAHELAAGPCEGAVTPALRAAARPLPLTGREREIATLAATGHTNKEIAERLTVSVRTVEGHLYRAGQKLGVHERAGMADLLGIE